MPVSRLALQKRRRLPKGALGPGGQKVPKYRAKSYRVHESSSSVWVWLHEEAPARRPEWPNPLPKKIPAFELINEFNAPIALALENFVDCAHTGFVHAGWFRGTPKKEIESVIERTATGVRIETTGESDMESLLSRLFIRRTEAVAHVDEFIFPSAVRVEYRFGRRRIVTTSICTPISSGQTRVFTRIALDAGPFGRLLLPLLKRYAQTIIDQDKPILADQAEIWPASRENASPSPPTLHGRPCAKRHLTFRPELSRRVRFQTKQR